jgi:hypothetical protein
MLCLGTWLLCGDAIVNLHMIASARPDSLVLANAEMMCRAT